MTSIFFEEVRDKKRMLSGAYNRTGKMGFVGKMRFPTDLLRGKEKRNHTKPGKVEQYNMYAKIMPYEDFQKLSPEDQKQTVEGYRKLHTNKQIYEFWNLKQHQYAHILKKVGITGNNKKKSEKPAPAKNTVEIIEKPQTPDFNKMMQLINQAAERIASAAEIQQAPTPEPPIAGLNIQYNGDFNASDLAAKLLRVAGFIEDETNEFEVTISIKEKGKEIQTIEN